MSNHTHSEPTREREVIVTNSGANDNGFSGAIVAVVAILAILLVGWFAVNAFSSGDGDVIPDDVNINVTDPGSGSGGGE